MKVRTTIKRRLSPVLLGATLSISFLSTACNSSLDATDAEASSKVNAIPVEVVELQSDLIGDRSEFVGNLEAVKVVEVNPEIQGRIKKILVEAGDRVEAGQTIMELEPGESAPNYQAAVERVNVAKDDYQNALKQLDIAKAKRDSAKTNYDLVSKYVPRVQELFDQGGVAQVRLDETLQKAEAAKNDLISAEQEVATAEVQINQAQTNIRQAQAQADAASVSANFTTIKAPIAGIVDDFPVKEGAYVSAGQSVVARITQSDDLFLNIQVPSNRANQLKLGLPLDLIDPTSKEKLSTGELTFISPTVDRENQTILARARFNNEGELRNGQYVQARLTWGTEPGILVPTGAISRTGGKEFVYQVSNKPNENGQEVVNLTPVELGDIQDNSYQVISGLETGDRIAVSNILKLRDGAPVQLETDESES
ncbi:efflux transporter periplasmic adaptor subunit [Pleurocapsa sp. CCALA 161]|uniref:efflux RND transporter periplasmic adaptor subunit n=1 Tax=Pleurocapsa sp. CCALA 161 TaxID=2107688 RepID=UPI000D05DAE5|nr:efflux RND transporter periplasmic adaptor subunit [Pleurocapsa sp. CCALA 161]PSB10078.1 efflux transporter periplasmic adaptor subunit [Pleurocapsa sp. CCALA 161]